MKQILISLVIVFNLSSCVNVLSVLPHPLWAGENKNSNQKVFLDVTGQSVAIQSVDFSLTKYQFQYRNEPLITSNTLKIQKGMLVSIALYWERCCDGGGFVGTFKEEAPVIGKRVTTFSNQGIAEASNSYAKQFTLLTAPALPANKLDEFNITGLSAGTTTATITFPEHPELWFNKLEFNIEVTNPQDNKADIPKT